MTKKEQDEYIEELNEQWKEFRQNYGRYYNSSYITRVIKEGEQDVYRDVCLG